MALDGPTTVERSAAIERHLKRVASRLPERAEDLRPMSDASDAVILHLWQAVQATIDLATRACVRLDLGTPTTYADAFKRLADAGRLDPDLAHRLARSAGFRNRLVHAYGSLDLTIVWHTARSGPKDIQAFLRAVATWV